MRLQSLTIRRMNVLQEFLRLNDFFQVGEEIQMKDKQYVFNIDLKNKKNLSRESIQDFFEANGFTVTGNEMMFRGLMKFKKTYLKISVHQDSPYLNLYRFKPAENDICHFQGKELMLCTAMKNKLEVCPSAKRNSFLPVVEKKALQAIKDPDTVLNYCPYCGAKILNDSQPDLFSGDYGDN